MQLIAMNKYAPFRFLSAVVLVVAALALAACGDDDDTAGSSASSGEPQATAEKRLEEHYEGRFEEPPSQSPRPESGKTVWVISCGQAAESCVQGANAAAEASKAIGWDAKVFDGKLDPALWGNGIRQAIAANADGIVTYAVDCEAVSQPLVEARRADIPVVNIAGFDCNETDPQAEPRFAASVTYVEGRLPEYMRRFGAAKADWLAAKSGGEAKVLNFTIPEYGVGQFADEGFLAGLEECGGCEVVGTVELAGSDIGPALQQKAQQALLKYPQATAVHVPFDALLVAGIAPAIRASGRADELLVAGGEGNDASLDFARDGLVDMGVSSPPEWEAYSAVDNLNRLFAGDKAAGSGIGLQVWDEDHNLPASGSYRFPVDYKAAFKEAWGVGAG